MYTATPYRNPFHFTTRLKMHYKTNTSASPFSNCILTKITNWVSPTNKKPVWLFTLEPISEIKAGNSLGTANMELWGVEDGTCVYISVICMEVAIYELCVKPLYTHVWIDFPTVHFRGPGLSAQPLVPPPVYVSSPLPFPTRRWPAWPAIEGHSGFRPQLTLSAPRRSVLHVAVSLFFLFIPFRGRPCWQFVARSVRHVSTPFIICYLFVWTDGVSRGARHPP